MRHILELEGAQTVIEAVIKTVTSAENRLFTCIVNIAFFCKVPEQYTVTYRIVGTLHKINQKRAVFLQLMSHLQN